MPTLPSLDDDARLVELERYAILDTPQESAFDDITALAACFFDVPIAIVSLVDRDRVWFKSAHGLGNVREIGRGPGLCASAILHDGVYVAPDLRCDADAVANPLVAQENGFRFYAAVPLRSAGGHNLGTFCIIDVVPRAFSANSREMLARFGRLVMAQMEQRLASLTIASLAREVAAKNSLQMHIATHDGQTGLLNRGAIHAQLQTLCSGWTDGQRLAVVLFDIDWFKSITDMHGHLAGDAVLNEVARRIGASVRPTDFVGRFGGTEFLVILVECDAEIVASVAERVRQNVSRLPVNFDGTDIWVTISAGAHVLPSRTPTETVLKAADDALYVAKRKGRNRVVFN